MMDALYKLSLGIGNPVDLHTMLDESVDAYQQALMCDCGLVYQVNAASDGSWGMKRIHSRCLTAELKQYQALADGLCPNGSDLKSLKAFYNTTPVILHRDKCRVVILPLEDFGALVLMGSNLSADQRLLKALDGVNRKLARACIDRIRLQQNHVPSTRTKDLHIPPLQEKAYLDQLFDNAQVGIIMADNDGTVLRINPEFQKIFGFSYEEAVGRNIDALVADRHDREQAARITHSVSEGQKHTFEAIRRTKAGDNRHVAVMASPIVLNGNQVAVYAFYRDITEQRQMEAELLNAKKLEATGKLAGGIAHDFNNMLAIIMGSIDIALLQFGVKAKKDVYHLEQARTVCARAHELTQKFITFSAGGMLIKKTIDLADLVRNIAEKQFEGTGVDCSIDLPDDLWTVMADPKQLRHALTEIMTNAAEALPDGGSVTITGANIQNGASDAEALTGTPQPCVQLTVADNGIGIPAEVLPQVFDPYYSTKQLSKKTGLGLGLTMVHSVVAKHGGTIRIASDPASGTQVVIVLPVDNASDL